MNKIFSTMILLSLVLGVPLISSAEGSFEERTSTENIRQQCLPEDIRYLPPEEVEARQTLLAGQSIPPGIEEL